VVNNEDGIAVGGFKAYVLEKKLARLATLGSVLLTVMVLDDQARPAEPVDAVVSSTGVSHVPTLEGPEIDTEGTTGLDGALIAMEAEAEVAQSEQSSVVHLALNLSATRVMESPTFNEIPK